MEERKEGRGKWREQGEMDGEGDGERMRDGGWRVEGKQD